MTAIDEDTLILIFEQRMYDPINRIILWEANTDFLVNIMESNTPERINLLSDHTGDTRYFNFLKRATLPDITRYVYINREMGVKLFIDVRD